MEESDIKYGNDKIKFLKSMKLQTYKTQGDVEAYLETLQDRYVIVPIDKASNNFAFVCKRYYVMRLLSEVGIPNGSCETYQITSRDKLLIIDNNVSLCDRYGLEVLEKEKCLPIMYWMPKMHKNPTDARFIIASSTCSTKPISSVISNVLSSFFGKFKIFMIKAHFIPDTRSFGWFKILLLS